MPGTELTSSVPSREEFRDVIGRFASGVTVISTRDEDIDYGAAASAVSSLSDEPPMVLICLRDSSTTAQAIGRSGRFVVNVLAEDSGPLAQHFASKKTDKFATISFERGLGDIALLAGSIAQLECAVEDSVRGGTHLVFLARVERVTAQQGNPLAYFRGTFGRMETAPDAATLHRVRDLVVGAVTDELVPLDPAVLAETAQVEVGGVLRALVALEREGMVRREGAGFAVEPVPDAVLYDYYAARLAIEVGVAAQIAGRVPADQLAELRTRMEATLDLVRDETFVDPAEWVRANAAFHEYLVSLAGSAILDDTYKALQLPALERRAIRESTRATGQLLDDHVAIVEAIEAGDADAAIQALSDHAARPRQTRGQGDGRKDAQ